jgi:hypothetical protein
MPDHQRTEAQPAFEPWLDRPGSLTGFFGGQFLTPSLTASASGRSGLPTPLLPTRGLVAVSLLLQLRKRV